MQYQLVIYSADAVFARMLELEFSMRGMKTAVFDETREDLYSNIAILDLDSATPPPPECYGRMIGFTRGDTMADEDTRRACSMILRRPFEMRLLRREVLAGGMDEREETERTNRIVLDVDGGILRINGREAKLTPKELLLMRALYENRENVVSREALAEAIGETGAKETDVYVCYLRRKLEKLTETRLIRTVRGKGYLLT